MGERFRLKASFDISTFPADVQVILKALKKYGLILADNGSSWYLTGAPDPRWNNDNLAKLKLVKGSDLEAVDATVYMMNANSGQSRACDANTDGVVDANDVQLMVQSAVGQRTCGFQDLDANGICTATDMQRVVNAALGLHCRVGQ
jgi:hypothetical protein